MPIEFAGFASIPVIPINAQDEALVEKLVRERAPRSVKEVPLLRDEDDEEETYGSTVQMSLIGAMQRAHPALTQLWLQWLGVPDLEYVTFDIVGPAEPGSEPATRITIGTTSQYMNAWSGLSDLMGLAADAPERRQNPMHVAASSGAHEKFWMAAQRRELVEVDGPLEWWWRLLVLRCRGVRAASRALLTALYGDIPGFETAVVSLTNPSLKDAGKKSSELIGPKYLQPTHLVVALRVARKATTEGLALPLSDGKVRAHFISTLLTSAVSVDLQRE